MSNEYYAMTDQDLNGLADSIREKTGTEGQLLGSQFKEKIDSIQSLAQPFTTGGEIYIDFDVPDYGFYKNTKITKVTFGPNCTRIGQYAFSGCTGLTEITIGENCTIINPYGFNNCTGITSLNFSEALTTIETYAFFGCTGLEEITISEGVTSIGDLAFGGNNNLKIINFNATNCSDFLSGQTIISRDTPIEEINFGENVTKIPAYFLGNYNNQKGMLVSNLDFPDSLKSIGAQAFCRLDHLSSINLNEGLEVIGSGAFRQDKLIQIELPSTITSLGTSCFTENPTLKNVIYNCVNATTASSSSSDSWLGTSRIETITINEDVKYLPHYFIDSQTSLTELTLPESLEAVGNYAFARCNHIENLTIPNSITTLPDGVFYNSIFTNLTIGTGVISFGAQFLKYSTVTNLYWNAPNAAYTGTTASGNGAFSSAKITNFCITNSVSSLGKNFFIASSLTKITNILVYKNTKVTAPNAPNFTNITVDSIKVPTALVDSYKNDTVSGGWSSRASVISGWESSEMQINSVSYNTIGETWQTWCNDATRNVDNYQIVGNVIMNAARTHIVCYNNVAVFPTDTIGLNEYSIVAIGDM